VILSVQSSPPGAAAVTLIDSLGMPEDNRISVSSNNSQLGIVDSLLFYRDYPKQRNGPRSSSLLKLDTLELKLLVLSLFNTIFGGSEQIDSPRILNVLASQSSSFPGAANNIRARIRTERLRDSVSWLR
jgi:hypothetical protein